MEGKSSWSCADSGTCEKLVVPLNGGVREASGSKIGFCIEWHAGSNDPRMWSMWEFGTLRWGDLYTAVDNNNSGVGFVCAHKIRFSWYATTNI